MKQEVAKWQGLLEEEKNRLAHFSFFFFLIFPFSFLIVLSVRQPVANWWGFEGKQMGKSASTSPTSFLMWAPLQDILQIFYQSKYFKKKIPQVQPLSLCQPLSKIFYKYSTKLSHRGEILNKSSQKTIQIYINTFQILISHFRQKWMSAWFPILQFCFKSIKYIWQGSLPALRLFLRHLRFVKAVWFTWNVTNIPLFLIWEKNGQSMNSDMRFGKKITLRHFRDKNFTKFQQFWW